MATGTSNLKIGYLDPLGNSSPCICAPRFEVRIGGPEFGGNFQLPQPGVEQTQSRLLVVDGARSSFDIRCRCLILYYRCYGHCKHVVGSILLGMRDTTDTIGTIDNTHILDIRDIVEFSDII